MALRDWKELQPGLYAAIELDMTAGVLMYVVLVSVVVLSLLNTILMSVLERTREFGMMMAIGVRPSLLSRIVWAETGIIAILGVSIGLLVGSLLTAWLAKTGIDFQSVQAVFERYGMSSTIHPELTPLTLIAGPFVHRRHSTRDRLPAGFENPQIEYSECDEGDVMAVLTLISPLAWRNLWRHRGRTLLTMLAVCIAVASMVILGSFLDAWSK